VKLGTIVNFVSHPVILGFMNAAAVIIALSQLDMLLGIPKGRSDSFLYDIWEMFGYLPQTHLPTLAMSVFALALMLGLKKIPGPVQAFRADRRGGHHPRQRAARFRAQDQGGPEHIADPAAQDLVTAYAGTDKRILEMAPR
jgi:SulP family sulfate permease